MNWPNYDGLVLVHADFGTPQKDPNYKQNILVAIKSTQEIGLPLFNLGGCLERVEGIRSHLRDAIQIPLIDHHYMEILSQQEKIDFQTEVDFISSELDKSPNDIKLLFGGTYADACVYYYARGWCKRVKTKYLPEEKLIVPKIDGPIRYGLILEDLV